MLKLRQLASVKLKMLLFLSIEVAIFNQQVFASPPQNNITYLCYIILTDGRIIDLNYLCERSLKKSNNETENLSNDLNYSSKIDKVQNLLQQLDKTSDETEVNKINSEIHTLQLEMMQNQQNYTRTDEAPQPNNYTVTFPELR